MSVMPTLDWVNDPVTKLRAGYAAERASISHFSADTVEIDEVPFASGTGLCFTPQELHDGADILYFHGGGWIVGSPWTHQTLCSWMAKLTGRRVFAAPYDLAPEHKFPAQADQALKSQRNFRSGVIRSCWPVTAPAELWCFGPQAEWRRVTKYKGLSAFTGHLAGLKAHLMTHLARILKG